MPFISRSTRLLAVLALLAFGFGSISGRAEAQSDNPIALVIHGGAGTIERARMTPERERAYRAGLEAALRTGYAVLRRGGTSVDAVEATIKVLEDNPLFNAGKGAVFTSAGTVELDAAIMNGATLDAGAVAGIKRVKNPIGLARAVMERSKHVMLIGDGAELFAREQGLQMVNNRYFWTPERRKGLQDAKRREAEERKRSRGAASARAEIVSAEPDDHRFGTVGCVALDRQGNIAAGTSTGGMTNKRWGRVGDVPVIGAGTYASNETCGVSCTGTGEYFIRLTVARDIAALMEYEGLSVKQAAEKVIMEKVTKLGGDGGAIALDRKGNIAMSFNTSGMYRGYVKPDGTVVTAIFHDEK